MNSTPTSPVRLHPRRLFHPSISLLVVFVLVSTACNLPFSTPKTLPTATAVVVPTAASSPTPTGPVAPTVVETDPLPQGVLTPDGGISLTFDQPMDHASVEGAIKLDPAYPGQFDWKGDDTIEFIPEQPFPTGSSVAVSLETSAHSSQGLALLHPLTYTFQTAGSLKVTQQLPEPNAADVDPASKIVVTFNRAVVALGDDTANQAAPISIDPAVKGQGKWVNTSTYEFSAQPSLAGGQTYTVSVNPDLLSVDGAALADGQTLDWSFSTALPAVTGIDPTADADIYLDAAFSLTFNQPMDTADVESNLALLDGNGSPVSSAYTWDANNSQVTLTPKQLLNRDTDYTLSMGSAHTPAGSLLTENLSQVYHTIAGLSVQSTNPSAGSVFQTYSDYGFITIQLTAPLADAQDLGKLVRFDPKPANLNISGDFPHGNIFISGLFLAATDYTLTLDAGLKDTFGDSLGQDYQQTFRASNDQPALTTPSLSGSADLYAVPGSSSIQSYVTNLDTLTIRQTRLTLEQYLQTLDPNSYQQTFSPDRSWTQSLSLPANQTTPVTIDLNPNGSGLEPGIYAYTFTSPQLGGDSNATNTRILVSPVQLTLKQSQDKVLVWATNVANKSVVAGRPVALYDTKDTLLGQATTDSDGLATIDLPAALDPYQTLVAVLGTPGDADYTVVNGQWNSGISPWNFSLPYNPTPQDTKIYLYTDRPIYQPGQTVYYRGVLRKNDDTRYQPFTDQDFTLQIHGGYEEETGLTPLLDTKTLPVSPYGTIQGEFTLPADARPGTYSIAPENDYENEFTFIVADYRKPEIDLQVNFGQSDYQAGQDVSVEVDANYFFGGAASDVPINWALYGQNYYFDIPGGYITGPVDTSWLEPNWYNIGLSPLGKYLQGASAKTGADGKLQLSFSAAELKTLLDTSGATTLTLEATISDESNQPVSQHGQATLHPANFYAGVRPSSWSTIAGSPIDYAVQTVDWDGKSIGNLSLSASFDKIEWQQDWTNSSLGGVDYQQIVTPVSSANFTTGADGRANLEFTPPDPGIYRLQISGNGALTQDLLWVSGPGSAPWPALPDQHLELEADQQQYQVGQTAQIFLPNPFSGSALALVTIERGEVLRSQVITISGSNYPLAVPIQNEDAPNVFVSVTLLGMSDAGTPDFRQGYVELNVDPSFLELQVSVTPASDPMQPGQNASFDIQVKDPLGNPVQGEFSFAAVDKAIYALADDNAKDIRDAFYGEQSLSVSTSTSLAASIGRLVAQPPGLGGGGGGGAPIVTSPGLRQNFEDTAYWNGSFETDASGKATIQFPLPDNLTTWVVTVRGLTRDALVGQAKTELTVTKSLIVRPVAPQFLVAGDRVQLGAVVNNNSANPLSVTVGIQAAGVQLEDSSQATQVVQVAASGRQRVNWWVDVSGADSASLVFSATAGSLSDSSTPTQGDIPILSYASPQSFGTSGVLTDAGDYTEIVSLPRSYTPTGGKLDIEMSPSLAGAILSGLDTLDSAPTEFTEPVFSRLQANLSAYDLVNQVPLQSPDLETRLQAAIRNDLDRMTELQGMDGGWGWSTSAKSDLYLTSYALVVVARASADGFFIDSTMMSNAISAVQADLVTPDTSSDAAQLDQLAFAYYALDQVNAGQDLPQALVDLRSKLDPWGQALLALTLHDSQPDVSKTILSDLSSSAIRSATGAHWQNQESDQQNFSTPLSNTAMVVYAMAEIDPAAPEMADAVRYVMASRQENGGWDSSLDTGWILGALTKAVLATGELQADFDYSASLNGQVLANGQAQGVNSLNPVQASVPLAQLAQSGNTLDFQRAAGNGRLYYQAYLQVGQPVESIQPLDRGLTISREYALASPDCSGEDCPAVSSVSLSDKNPVVNVRLTVTVPEDMYYLVVEDNIPAGTEIVNTQLNTAQVGTGDTATPQYDPEQPLGDGWGWWYFNDPGIYSDHIRWVASYVPAGTYVLTYRLTPDQAGQFHVLPARAYQYYFPDVEGRSAGAMFEVKQRMGNSNNSNKECGPGPHSLFE